MTNETDRTDKHRLTKTINSKREDNWLARFSDITEQSICGAGKFAYNSSIKFAPQLRTSQRPTLSTEQHTPRTLRGGRVIQRHSRHTTFM